MNNISIFILISLAFCCNKATDEPIVKEKIPVESYIKKILEPDTSEHYSGSYYIHVVFKNQDISVHLNVIDFQLYII
jgi:hypothetical protein